MKHKIIFYFLIIFELILTKSVLAVPAYPGPIKYTQPDGSVITVQLKGDERVHWAESSDGYTLLSNGKNGWEYAVTNEAGDLKVSGVLAREVNKRTVGELKLLQRVEKRNRFSQKQVNMLKSVWEVKNGSDKLIGTSNFFKPNAVKSSNNDGRQKVFSPNGTKKLLMILIQYPDKAFTFTKNDFTNLTNTQNYNLNGAHGSVRDYFREQSYWTLDPNKGFDVATTVVGIYTAKYNMDYYGADAADGSHDPNSNELMLEAVQDADPDVDFTQYDNDGDGSVDGVYIVYAGYGQASSGIANTIWPHAGGISGQTFDGKTVSKYSCSNELNSDGSLTGIGVICHEFGHVCGAPDYYDTDYDTGGQFPGTGDWDIMCGGCYNGFPSNSGNVPSHFNPLEKIKAGWITPFVLSTTSSIASIPDITTSPVVYKYNTATANEYYLLENRQQTGFNSYCPSHGLMIYHYSQSYWNATKNKTAPQGFYLVCANNTTNPTTISDGSSYGDINSVACPFPGSSGKTAFYDTGMPSSKSWSGANTGLPLTNIKENVDGTISLNMSAITTCSSAPTSQASALTVTPVTYNTMNFSWTRGTGDKVIIVAREGSAVDFDPLSGTNYTANANFKSGDEVGSGNYVVYNGTGTSASLTGLSGGTTYYFSVYEYNNTDACYLNPALTGAGTTNCTIDAATFTESFERSSFGCWTLTDNTGQGNWKIGTTTNTNLPPNLNGNYAYFKGEYAVAHSYNADLISPTFDLSTYTGVSLEFKHHFDASNSYPSTGTVYYSINNGDTWNSLATYTSDQNNATVSLNLPVAVGRSQVKFKWNYSCSPTGAFMWAVDDIQVKDVPENPSSVTATATSSSQINLSWTKNSLSNDVIIAYSPTNIFGTPVNGTTYSEGTSLSGGGTVLYKGSLTTFNHTGLNASTTYYYKIWSVSATNKYSAGLTPVSETTDCSAINTLPFEENFTAGTLPSCWKAKDNSGQGNWQFGTTSNVNYTPALTGSYAYFKSTYGVAHNYNADLISPTFDFSIYGGVALSFTHLFDASGSYPSTGTVYYSIDNGVTWNSLATYTSDSSNPQVVTLGICAVAGQSNVKFKWTYTCSPTGAYMWAVDDIKIAETSGIWNGSTNTDWHTASNWCSNTVPTATTNVIIPTGVTNMPSITNTTVATCKDIILQTSTTLTMAANTELDVKGNWNMYGSMNGNTSSLVKFNGSVAQSIGGSTYTIFKKLKIDNTSGMILSTEARVDVTLELTNGLITTTGSGKVNMFGGSVTRINGWVNGTLQKYTWTTTTSNIYEIGDATNYTPVTITFPSGSITGGGGLAMKTTTGDHPNIATSTLNSAKSVNRYWSFPYNGITFSSCNIVFNYLSGDLDASVSTDNLLAGKYLSTAWTYPTVGTKTSTSTQIIGVTSLGDFVLAEGPKITVSTGGNWSNAATWSPAGVPVATDNIVITSPATVIVDVNPTVCNDLSIQNGAILNVAPGKSLTVNGTFTNNAGVTGFALQSDANGTATFKNAGSVNTSIPATVQQYLATGRNWYVSTPVTGATSNVFGVGSTNKLAYYNETANPPAYVQITDNGTTLIPGTGYVALIGSGTDYSFTGTLNDGTITLHPSRTGTDAAKRGFNLIGNPYPSFLDWNAVTKTNVGSTIWYRTKTTGTDMTFDTYNGTVGTANGEKGTVSQYIPPMQAFWVRVNGDGQSGTLLLNNNMRSHQDQSVTTNRLRTRSESNDLQLIRLKVSNRVNSDEAILVATNNASDGIDEMDAPKMSNQNTNIPEIYTLSNNEELTINCQNNFNTDKEFALGFRPGKAGTYSIIASEISNLNSDNKIIIADQLNTTETTLGQDGIYTFTSDGTTTNNRFVIRFNSSSITTENINTENDKDIYVYQNSDKQVVVSSIKKIPSNSSVLVYNALGQRIINTQLHGTKTVIAGNLSCGVYFVEVKLGTTVITRKVVFN